MSPDSAPGPLLLVVEDNATNLLLIRAVLQRGGYRVAAAGSAEEAEQWLANNLPFAILMDIQLPGRDGLSLTTQLKGQERTAMIPIIALTAHAMRADRERALAAGCDGYLAKPIDTRTLVSEIEKIIGSAGSSTPVQVWHG
jgi:CheY-like chemotaxis protein